MGLSGKTVLITRAAHQAEDFISFVRQEGGETVLFPTIEIAPPDSWEACDRSLDGLHMYDGLLFTSINAVDFFFRRMSERNIDIQAIQTKMICVVGERTRQAIERRGFTVTTVPEKYTALDLARTLQQEDLNGKAFLFPRGNLAQDTLPALLKNLGASVDAVIFYQTQAPGREHVDSVKEMLLGGKIDVATFTSPSTFQNFISLFSKDDLMLIKQHMTIAVIGPTTARAVEEAGFDVDIRAPESTVLSLTKSIADYFSTKASVRNAE